MITLKLIIYIIVCAITTSGCLCFFDNADMFFPNGVLDAKLEDWANALWSSLSTIAVVLVVGIILGSLLGL